MQAQCHQHKEYHSGSPHISPNIAAVSDDASSVDSSPCVEMSESEGGMWPDHPNVSDDYTHDRDLVGPIIIEPNPDPSSPVIVSEGDHYNHHKDPLVPL